MAVSVAVPVGKETADRLMEKLIPRVESLKVGPSTDAGADLGPLVTKEAMEAGQGLCRSRHQRKAQTLSSMAAGFKMQGYEDGFYMGGCLFDKRHRRHAHLQGRKSSAPCSSVVARGKL